MCEELADVNEKLGQLIRNKIENGLIPLKKCLQEGVEKGEIRNVFDIDELANFIDNSWRGAIMRVKADQSPKAMDIYEKFILEYLLKQKNFVILQTTGHIFKSQTKSKS
eukprot:TRINITY_DN65183_c0_g1_i1.p1 TRINITY_DN65183_c0_g1~~TRINITY_DN65183_c0_g1_i1.p1  ORF type:complete len:128 (-),score=14.47 TRINITY_DN65183_c0_g1_i1:108-434(-)